MNEDELLQQERREANREKDKRRRQRARIAKSGKRESERAEAAAGRRSLPPDVAREAEHYFGEEIYAGVPEPPYSKRGKPFAPGNRAHTSRGEPPEGLTDLLGWVLSRKNRIALAHNLVAMAKGNGPLALQATQYIFDRMEGKPRQSVIEKRDEQDPLIELIKRVLNDPQAAEVGAFERVVELREPFAEAEVREIPSQTAEARLS